MVLLSILVAKLLDTYRSREHFVNLIVGNSGLPCSFVYTVVKVYEEPH